MKIFLIDQSEDFEKHLEFLKAQRVVKYDRSQLKEKITHISLNTTKSLQDLDLDFFFEYKIFPKYIMTFLTQWHEEKRSIREGDTILQQAFLPPISKFSLKMIFGVRINRIIDEHARRGFSYETLVGHPEMGESIFTIEKSGDKSIIFKIHTYSKPGSKFSQLIGPIFTVPYQTYCTAQALRNVKRLIATLH